MILCFGWNLHDKVMLDGGKLKELQEISSFLKQFSRNSQFPPIVFFISFEGQPSFIVNVIQNQVNNYLRVFIDYSFIQCDTFKIFQQLNSEGFK